LSSDYVVDGIALTEVPALELPKSLPPGVKL